MNKKRKNIIAIVPARYASTRFPGKLLADLNGLPVILHTLMNISKSKYLQDLYVATDDDRIAKICNDNGYKVIITPNNFNSGTDRIAFALETLQSNPQLIINCQADEPFIDADSIDELILKITNSNCDAGTIISPIKNIDELLNSSIVKVIVNEQFEAIYFSRSPIPFIRDIITEEWLNFHTFYKHIGIYAFKSKTLKKFISLKPSKLELAEKLEQLRLIEAGYKFLCTLTEKRLIGIDTPEELELARRFLQSH